jgi:hypothetical protein
MIDVGGASSCNVFDRFDRQGGREPPLFLTGGVSRLKQSTTQLDSTARDLKRRDGIGEMGYPVYGRLEQTHPQLARGEHCVWPVMGDDVLLAATNVDATNGMRDGV